MEYLHKNKDEKVEYEVAIEAIIEIASYGLFE